MRKFLKGSAAALLAAALLAGCGQTQAPETKGNETKETEAAAETAGAETQASEETKEAGGENAAAELSADTEGAPEIAGLTCIGQTPLEYATAFKIYHYDNGCKVLWTNDDRNYLIVPEGTEAPAADDMIVLQQPVSNIYLAATSSMSLFDAMDAIPSLRFSSLQKTGWYVTGAVEAMEAGDLIYAGKYSEPDYELLMNEGCELAIESTMILHSPKVQEMIELLDIPVFIDRSSYEQHSLGRTEWIKAYAAIVGKEAEAAAFFGEQAKSVESIDTTDIGANEVAYFFINTDGIAVVRNSADYISNMIKMGGGVNSFEGLAEGTESATVNLTLEDFYAAAEDADYIIYTTSIDATVKTLDDLLAKNEVIGDFKAVKEGNVWKTGSSLYQATDIVSQLAVDVNKMLKGEDESSMTFLSKLK